MSVSPNQARDLAVGSLLSDRARQAARAVLMPVVRLAVRLGLTANTVTVIGFGVAVGGAGLVAAGELFIGALVLTAGLLLDAVDGAVARATGGTTAFGGFLDSTLDRAAEATLYAGVMVHLLRTEPDPVPGVLLAAGGLSASFLVSYTRAKAESLGVKASVGLAPRLERLILMVAGIGLTGLGLSFGIMVAMAVVAGLAALTTLQRIWHVRRQLGGRITRETRA
ncbi:MAG TPA: CDP-alcohol phosphatidyltransferase family protein [Candidatus Limnocylindria bacterium]|nr:CDP-alcohol phosphatidyltransferase family protein [Candidatus Limnocylindria bacterium]